MELQTVFTSAMPVECHIMKGRLETEGITCFIYDENVVSADPFKSVMVGGVKLKVPVNEADKAREIIKAVESGALMEDDEDAKGQAEERSEPVKPKSAAEGNEIKCPKCGSSNVRKGYSIDYKWNLWYLLLTLIMMAPFPLYRKNYHCFDCQANFKIRKRDLPA